MPATQTEVVNARAKRITRRGFLASSVAAGLGLALYSNDLSRHELTVTRPTFYIRDLPPAFDGFRFVQISDLHLEEYTEDWFLRRVIRHVNALSPDLVLVTGDFVSRGPMSIGVSYAAAARCAELLTALRCPQRFGVLGNHDVSVGAGVVRGHMEYNGLPLLVNQHVKLERNGEHIFLAGVDDIAHGAPDLNDAVPETPDAPVILMAHEPDYAVQAVRHPRGKLVDLMLSGHTHGGQVCLPGVGALALPLMGKLFAQGHFEVADMQLYVNRGIGTVGMPFRLNCPPEITLATLRRAPRSV